MNLVRLEISDVRLKKCDVPDEADTALTARLCNITRVTNGKGPACVRLSSELALHLGNFDLQSFLRLFLIYPTDALADPNPEISFVDESSAVRWCASRGHELILP